MIPPFSQFAESGRKPVTGLPYSNQQFYSKKLINWVLAALYAPFT
jgi:hypothetical protein